MFTLPTIIVFKQMLAGAFTAIGMGIVFENRIRKIIRKNLED